MTERERLIELLDHYIDELKPKTLADYLLDNGVIVPKYKIGDKVYFIKSNTICNATIVGVAKVKNTGFWHMLHTASYKFEKNESSLYETKEQAEKH